ncbi:hypothetical protein AX16_002497 [Volvariella volvacea WC 439]|nr:hypothetical protein AX16_002497 [Volvariella volvacea WC 439]
MPSGSLLSLLSLSILSLSSVALAGTSCVAFDVNWNLLAFGFGDKDYNAGTQDTWASGTATDITTSGRPPFNGPNVTCYLSQFTNAIYVLGADSSDPAAVHIYDATAKSWSTQPVNAGNFDPTSFNAILDHDTNVFYALSHGSMYSLDMELLKAAEPEARSWNDVQRPAFAQNGYEPVMALAQNHVHFMNVPGLGPGQVQIFVIHFSYVQPEPQSYGEPAFPATHGQATSFFLDVGVQQEFVFIPDDGSATYVMNVESNTTQALQGPSEKDALATYFASTSALVQLTSSGSVFYLPYDANQPSANAGASWSAVSKLPIATPASPATSASQTGTGTGSGTANPASQTTDSRGQSSSSENSENSAFATSINSVFTLSASALLALSLSFI